MIGLEGRYDLMDCDEALACLREGTSVGAQVSYVDGKLVKVAPVTFTIICNVQPMSGQSLKLVPEGDRYSDGLMLWVPQTAGMTMILANDKVLRNGSVYQVQSANDWGDYTQAGLQRVDVGPDVTSLFAAVDTSGLVWT